MSRRRPINFKKKSPPLYKVANQKVNIDGRPSSFIDLIHDSEFVGENVVNSKWDYHEVVPPQKSNARILNFSAAVSEKKDLLSVELEVKKVRYGKSSLSNFSKVSLQIQEEKNFKKIRHDIVASGITGKMMESDVKFNEKFPGMAGEDERLSPDFFYEDDDKIVIMELKTTKGGDMPSICRAALTKYLIPLRTYKETHNIQKKIFMHAIVVSENKIFTSFKPVSAKSLESLCDLFSIGYATENNLKSLGVKMTDLEDDFEKEILNVMNKNSYKLPETNSKAKLSEEMIDNFRNFNDKTYNDLLSKEIDAAYIETSNRIKKGIEMSTNAQIGKKAFEEFSKQDHAYDKPELGDFCPEYGKLIGHAWYDGNKTVEKVHKMKSVIKFPLISKPLVESEKKIQDLKEGNGDSATSRLWNSAITDIRKKIVIEKTKNEKIEEIEQKGYMGELIRYAGGEHNVKEKDKENRALSPGDMDRVLEWRKKEYDQSRKNRLELEEEIMKKKEEYKRLKKENQAFSETLDYESHEQAVNLKKAAIERNQNSRVNVEIAYPDRIQLAKRGFQGKEYEHFPQMIAHKRKSQIPFDIDKTETTDIADCISDYPWWFETVDEKATFVDEELKKIFNDALKDCPKHTGKFYDVPQKELDNFSKTRIAHFLGAIDRVVEEVNISLTQYCAKDELIMKKIGKFDMYLLIKPTAPDKSIFYSIMINKNSVEKEKWGKVFIHTLPFNEDYVITEICSLQRNRISHLIFSRETIASIWASWLEMSKSILENSNRNNRVKTAMRHTIGSMLFDLETTAKASETSLLARYMYMEATNETLHPKNIAKICEKFTNMPRSRFVVFIMKRIMYVATYMKYNPPKSLTVSSPLSVDEELSERASDNFSGVISWITLEELDSYKKILFASYLGVLRNKDEGDVNQGNYKIFEKICSEEVKLSQDDFENLGFKDQEETGGHRFSPSAVILNGKAVRDYIGKKNGSFSGWFYTQFMRTMQKKRWEEIATFKASAVKTPTYIYEECSEEMNRRVRALEGVMALLRNKNPGASPAFRNLSTLIDALGTEYEKAEIEKVKDQYDPLVEQNDSNFRDYYDSKETDSTKGRRTKRANYTTSFNESLYDMVDNMESPMLVAIQAIKWIEDREKHLKERSDYFEKLKENPEYGKGGVHANLFKKQQITGPREIFVLDILSRLVILFVETISRLLCAELPWEMLTKGTEKVKRTEEHYANVEEIKRNNGSDADITSTDSLDKTTWCQKFVMPLFGSLYYGILDQEDEFESSVYYLICRVLNLVANKRLEMPKSMLDDFLDASKIGVRSFSDLTNKMKDEFRGDVNTHDLCMIHETGLFNISNMLQGILHYTSSLLHSAHALSMMKIFKKVSMTMLTRLNPDSFIYCPVTFKVSSDDSSFLQTIAIKTIGRTREAIKTDRMRAAFVLTYNSVLEDRMARHSCMFLSDPKSTRCNFAGIEEFNSLWMVRNTFISPVIKFIYASLKPKVTSAMEDRIRTFAELRKQIMENCGSFYLTSFVMICQFLIHYRLLGSRSSDMFSFYSSLLGYLRNPSLGWMTLDLANFCGLFSYNINLSNLMITSEACRLTANWIYKTRGTAVTEDGKPSIKISLVIGSKIRWRKFLLNLGIPTNYERIAESKPWMLLENTKTTLESVFKIYKKALTPSSSEAFSFQPGSKMHAASVYMLTHASMSKREKIDNEWTSRWSSLISFCLEAVREIYDVNRVHRDFEKHVYVVDTSTTIDVDVSKIKTLLFPSLSQQDDITEIADQMSYATITEIDRLSTKMVSLNLPAMTERSPISFAENVKRFWFPGVTKVHGTRSEHSYAKIFFQNLFYWYKDSFKETISSKDFPFNGWITMFDFIKSLDDKTPTVKIASPVRRGLNLHLTVMNMMKLNYADGYALTFEKLKFEKNSNKLVSVSIILSRFLTSYECMLPDSIYYLEQLIKRLRNNIEDVDLPDLLKERCSDTEFITFLIVKSLADQSEGRLELEEVKNVMFYLRKGMIIFFKQEQDYNPHTSSYSGLGVLGLIIDKCHAEVTMMDSYIVSITTNNQDALVQVGRKLARIFKKMNIGFKKFDRKSYNSLRVDTVYFNADGSSLSRPSLYCLPINLDPSLRTEEIKGVIRVKLIWGKGLKLYQELNSRKVTIGFLPADNPFEMGSYIELKDMLSFHPLSNQFLRGEQLDIGAVRTTLERTTNQSIGALRTKCLENKEIVKISDSLKTRYHENLIAIYNKNHKNVDTFWGMMKESQGRINTLVRDLKFEKSEIGIKELNTKIERELKTLKVRIQNFKDNLREHLLQGTIRYDLANDDVEKINMEVRRWCLYKWIVRLNIECLCRKVGVDSNKHYKENMNYSKLRLNYDGNLLSLKKREKQLIKEQAKVNVKENVIKKNTTMLSQETSKDKYSKFIRMYELRDQGMDDEAKKIEDELYATDWALSDDSDEERDEDVLSEENFNENSAEVTTLTVNSPWRFWDDFTRDLEKTPGQLRTITELVYHSDSLFRDQYSLSLPMYDDLNEKLVFEYYLLLIKYFMNLDHREANTACMAIAMSSIMSYSEDASASDGESLISSTINKLDMTMIMEKNMGYFISAIPEVDESFARSLEEEKSKPVNLYETNLPEYFKSRKMFTEKDIANREQALEVLGASRVNIDSDQKAILALLCDRTIYREIKREENTYEIDLDKELYDA